VKPAKGAPALPMSETRMATLFQTFLILAIPAHHLKPLGLLLLAILELIDSM
jgi:hypothetical protein